MIGLFDSGLGGLTVTAAIQSALPAQPILYFADQAHVPYGQRSLEEVRGFSHEIARFLIASGAQVLVVACNTASAAALHSLRAAFPATPVVGMEPALKPAVLATRSGVVGVLATPATFQGELYHSLMQRFASDVDVRSATCPGLVEQIEAGDLQSPATRRILEEALLPMRAAGMDALVLGCTHYPLVRPLMQEIAGAEVHIIDPAPAIARQTARILAQLPAEPANPAGTVPDFYLTSGAISAFKRILPRLHPPQASRPSRFARVKWAGQRLPARLEVAD